MKYIDSINYLYGLQKHGIKLGLEKIERILSILGNPHKNFLSIHVAGTNGKGSVSAMTASMLQAYGFKTGLFTSPHINSFTERIRINNEQIPESEVISLTEEIKHKIQNLKYNIPQPTFFEFVTAMAFLYFARNNVDWAVIEVGMGGRLDATNVIKPEVSVITRIDYDHKDFLGETLTEIAKEKAGIIKKEIPVVSSLQEKEAEEVIIETSKRMSSDLYMYGRDFWGNLTSIDIKGITFDYHDLGAKVLEIKNLFVPLTGEYQLQNACVALKTVNIATNKISKKINNSEHILKLKRGLSNTIWRGRLELISNDPPIMIDAAHNPGAAKAISEFIKKYLSNYKLILILGIMSDKDIPEILKPLLPLASDIIFTAPKYDRATSPKKLSEYALSIGYPSIVTDSVKEALEKGFEIKERYTSPLILITGSFYTIGEAMEALGETAILGRLREKI